MKQDRSTPPLVPARAIPESERVPSVNGAPPKLPQPEKLPAKATPVKLIPAMKLQLAEVMSAIETLQPENVMQAAVTQAKPMPIRSMPEKAVPDKPTLGKSASTISPRESVVLALLKAVTVLEDADTKVYRNLDKPAAIPSGGLIILRDNETAKEVDVLLSPLTYTYELTIQIEVMIQHPDSDKRSLQLDLLLSMLSSAIAVDRTLQGLAEHVEVGQAEFQDDPVEGAATIRSAILPVLIRFSSTK